MTIWTENLRLAESLQNWGHPRLLVIGDLMLDRYTWGEAERISPEAPVLVLREDLDEVRPGGAANVASFLRALEADVFLAGVVGDDADGRTLRRLLDDMSVETSDVIADPERPTTTKQRFVGRAAQRQPHQILRVDRESRAAISADTQKAFTARVLERVATCDAVLVSDYGKGVCTPDVLRAVIDHCREHGIPILADPSRGGDYQRYARATLIAPNRVAAELLFGKPLRDPEAIGKAATRLREQLELVAAVLTLDRDGLAYATATDAALVPSRPREVCDVTGAGDMVLAVLGMCQARRISLMDSLRLANTAAGLEVERFGVEPISRADITRELSRDHSNARQPITLEEMLVHVSSYRRSGRSIVFTNGCFDLLHVGHVALLDEAARLGDVLIVAINSDASVRKLKGSDRPIIGQADRARMLAALACVDHVLIFEDDTPHRLLEAIRPDVLVKGGTTGHIVGREVVERFGGTVIHVGMRPGRSTTALVEQIRYSRIETGAPS